MAARDELGMLLWILNINAHCLVPPVRDRNEMWIDGFAHARGQIGKGIAEILVLPSPEAMPSHDHTAAKDLVFGIQPGRCLAFITIEEPLNHRASMGIEILRDTLPVNIFDPLQNAVRLFREEYVHMSALRQIRTTITILAAISIFNT